MLGMKLLVVLFILEYSLCFAQIRVELGREEIPLKIQEVKEKPFGRAGLTKNLQTTQILKNYKNVYYYGFIKMGTPGEAVRVIFDTGSPSLWVYSGSGYWSWLCIACWFHRTYHHSWSSTYVPDGRKMEINYVSGYMRGFVSNDIMTIGNLRVPVSFAEATDTPVTEFIGSKFDGILGLAPCSGYNCPVYKGFTPSVVNPILSNLFKPIFSVYLSRETSRYGEILFGGTNTDLYREETLVMHTTSNPYMWTVKIQSIWFGNRQVLNYNNGVDAFIDTGTSLIAGPFSDVVKLLQLMDLPTQGLQIDCNRRNYLPPLTFVIGGQNYSLTWDRYASSSTTTSWGEKVCYHGLQSVDIGNGGWILGDIFISSFYTIFEVGNQTTSRIGFAHLKNT